MELIITCCQFTNSVHSGKLKPATWEQALTAVAKKLSETKPEDIEAIAGSFADAEVGCCMKSM